MTEQQGEYATPFRVEPPPAEPGEGAVIAWQKQGHSGTTLTYVSLRAGGKWYTTGRETLQGVSWAALLAALRASALGPVMVATAWTDLDLGIRREVDQVIEQTVSRAAELSNPKRDLTPEEMRRFADTLLANRPGRTTGRNPLGGN